MTEIKILIEGYAKKVSNGWLASSAVTLIRSNSKNIITDPGCNRKRLIEELSKNNLKPTDIDFVLLTHSHADHVLLAGIFENALIITNEEIYQNDKQFDHGDNISKTGLKIIHTPGHSVDSCSFIVKTDKEIFVIAGDVFWWKDDEKQKTDIENLINHLDPYMKDEKILKNSRKKILEIADYVIPGHGKMFKVEK